jgi:hypothetical protein
VHSTYVDIFESFATRPATLRTGGQVLGCTADDLQEVRQWHDSALPGAFEAFLISMGRRAGAMWRAEDDHFFPGILGLGSSDVSIFADELGVTLPEGVILPFASHDGYEYQSLLLDSNSGDDPAVWQLLDAFGPSLKQLCGTFTAYIEQQVRATEKYVSDHPEWNFP